MFYCNERWTTDAAILYINIYLYTLIPIIMINSSRCTVFREFAPKTASAERRRNSIERDRCS